MNYTVIEVLRKASPVYSRGRYIVEDENGNRFEVLAGNKKKAEQGEFWGDPKPVS